jgi:hypothetical protein
MERRHLEGRLAESLSHLTDIEREERLEDRIKKSTARLAELARPGAAQTLLQAEEQYLAHLQEALASRNSAHLKVSRQQTEESISEAKRLHEMALSEIEDLGVRRDLIFGRLRDVKEEIDRRRARIINLRNEPSPELYNVFQRSDALLRSAKGNTELARRHPTLALEIYEQIRKADLVLVIAGTYDQYRGWMEFEFAIAADLAKTVVAILPPRPPAPRGFKLRSKAPRRRMRRWCRNYKPRPERLLRGGVVYGGDQTLDAAKFEIQTIAPKLGLTNAAIYYRQVSYRSVATTTDGLQAEQLLLKAKERRKDSYIVNMSTWCRDAAQKNGYFECASS